MSDKANHIPSDKNSFSAFDEIEVPLENRARLKDSKFRVYALLKFSCAYELKIILKIPGQKLTEKFKFLKSFNQYQLLKWESSLLKVIKYKEFKVKFLNTDANKSKIYTQKIIHSDDNTSKPQEIFLFKMQLQGKNKSLKAKKPHDILEAALVYTYLLSLTDCEKLTFYNLFVQMPKSIKPLLERLQNLSQDLLESEVGQYFRLPYDISLALNGKLISWGELGQLKDINVLKKCNMILPEFRNDYKEIIEIMSENDKSRLEFILNGIHNKIILDLKLSNSISLYQVFLQNLKPTAFESHIDLFEQLQNFDEKNKLQKQLIQNILKKEISNEQKVYYLYKIINDENKSINQIIASINDYLLNSASLNINTDAYDITYLEKAVTVINRKLEKMPLWTSLSTDDKITFYIFISQNTHPTLKKIIQKSFIKTTLNDQIKNLFDSRKTEDMDFMEVVFSACYDKTLITCTLDQYINEFIKPISFWSTVPLASHMDHFFQKFLVPLILQKKNEQIDIGDPLLGYLEKWGSLRFYSVDQIFQGFENILSYYSHEDSTTIAKYICLGLFRSESLENLAQKHFKAALKCKSVLKDLFIESFLSKLEKLSRDEKDIAIRITIDHLQQDSTNKEDWKSEVRAKLLVYGDKISFNEVKYAMLSEPNICRMYSSVFRTLGNQNNKTIISLIECLNKIVKLIVDEEISYGECKKIKNFKKSNKLDWIIELLEFAEQKHDMRKVFERLFEKCRAFELKIKEISFFIDYYNKFESIKPLQISVRSFSETYLPFYKVSDLKLPDYLDKFSRPASQYNKILNSRLFKYFIKIENNHTADEIIAACDTAYDRMCIEFAIIADRLRQGTLTMDIIQRYFSKSGLDFEKDMSKILAHTEFGEDEITKLREALSLYQEHHYLIFLSNRLIDLYNILKFDKKLLLEAKSYSEVANNLDNTRVSGTFLVTNFVERAIEFKNQLFKNGFADVTRKNSFNQITCNLSMAGELWKLLGSITKDDFIELKEFINDQDETYVNSKVIQDFEQVWSFQNTLVNQCENLQIFLAKCKEVLKQDQLEGIANTIKECNNSRSLVEKALIDMKNRDASFKFRITEMMKRSKLKIEERNFSKVVTVVVNYNGSEKIIEKEKLLEFKEKVLLFMNSQRRQEEAIGIDLDALKQFVILVDAIEVIMKSYLELDKLGYIQTFINQNQEKIEFEIIDKDIEAIIKYQKEVREYNKKWKFHLTQLYSESYVFSHFYGKQLKDLYESIFIKKDQKSNPVKYLLLWAQISYQAFQENISRVRIEDYAKQDSFQKILFISKLLEKISLNNTEAFKRFDSFKQQPKVKLVSVSKAKIVLAIAASVPEKQMHDTRLSQFLFCHPNTNPTEIICFLSRAFLNNQSLPHFIVGFEYLNAQLQNFFCENLESSLKILASLRKNLNLVLIGSSTTEIIYDYFYHHQDFKKEVVKDQEIDGKVSARCTDTLLKMIERCEIVCSKSAGLGKTHYILKKCKEKNLIPYFFPIAGNISEERIGQRLRAINFSQNTALIIQIHNVVDKNILDEILFQIIFFRSLKNDSYLFSTEHKPQIFVEIQNILGEKYITSLRTLSLFQGSKYLHSIEEAHPENLFIISPKNEIRFYFVMRYLKAMNEGKLELQDIPYSSFEQEFEVNCPGIEENNCKYLANEYFFAPLREHNPSFTQFRCFIELLFSALKTFSESLFFSIAQLDYAFGKLKQSIKKDLIKMIRSDFVNILIQNSRDFVIRTVYPAYFSDLFSISKSVISFQERLKEFPLLLMSQGENQNASSYSLIYNEIKRVPKELKMFFLLQSMASPEAKNLGEWLKNEEQLNLSFINQDPPKNDSKSLLEKLRIISGVAKIEEDLNYAITKDNFYKMCLIIQRMRSQIPIVIMGETGVGKTALIRFLVQNVYHDDLEVINIHAGVNEKELIQRMEALQKRAASLSSEKRLWVFFDEFNTSEEVGLISEVLLNRRFLGEPIKGNLVFLGACNPFRKREEKKVIVKAGIPKTQRVHEDASLYKVLPPPESLIEVMWDYQDLKEAETLEYLAAILKIDYKIDKVIEVINFTHKYIQKNIEKSAVSLRDVARFKILYEWFHKQMPSQAPSNKQSNNLSFGESSNYNIPQNERAFILTLCFCYYLRLPLAELRQDYIKNVESLMEYQEGYILQTLENEQTDLLKRMDLPEGTALNLALRENVFAAFVCLMNKIPIIIVGMPGCSKSLAMRLLMTNLRGQQSSEEYFKNLEELSIVHFQGSESCTSESVEKVFVRAERNLKMKNVIPTILFDEIGLAELSAHNPLKVLHSHLEVGRTDVSFIGISNWELDAAKMGRFLVISRPIPEDAELEDTATKIFESITDSPVGDFEILIKTVSGSYKNFIQKWKSGATRRYPEFFGLRDFYSLVNFISTKIKSQGLTPQNYDEISKLIKEGVQRNFDGQEDSKKTFLQEVEKYFYNVTPDGEEELDAMSIIQESLKDSSSRSILAIVRGDALIHMASKNLKFYDNELITICGSSFEQDKLSEEYDVRVISQFITYVQEGYVVACKDINNAIQTSLYDLYNKSYQKIGGNNYCRIAVGAHSNPKCLVHPKFNCIVYINEAKLSEVDPPFLNRFEKHFLTLDRFLNVEELTILEEINNWIEKITPKYSQDEPPLQKENFIVNCSREALASLCIKVSYQLKTKIPDISSLDLIKKSVDLCKEELLRNTTQDFILWIESSKLVNKDKEEYDFLKERYNTKNQIDLNNFSKELDDRLIIFTYERINNFVVPEATKVIRIVEMKCEKDLKLEIQSYFESTNELCIIKMDYETEIVHLSLLLFLIDNAQKTFKKSSPKSFVIILHYSRIAAARSNKAPLKSISYLNGWSQIFIESFSNNTGLKVDELPPTLLGIMNNYYINLTNTIPESFENAITKFDFKFKTDFEDCRSLSAFVKFLLEISNDKLFIKLAEEYLLRLVQNNQFADWRSEILQHKDIAKRAVDVKQAITLYISEKTEDLLTIILKRLFDEQSFTSIFPLNTLALLEQSAPGVKNYFQRKLNCAVIEPHLDLIEEIFKKSLSSKLPTQTLQKARAKSVEVILSYPRLFPFSKKDEKYIFIQEDDRSSASLHSIALQLKEIEYSFILEESAQESNAEYDTLMNSFNQTFKEKTHLIKLDQEGKCVMDILSKLNSRDYLLEKELYLTDIRNMFVEQIAKVDIKTSNFLDELIMVFMQKDYQLESYLMILLRGHALWKPLLQIYQIITTHLSDTSALIKRLFFPSDFKPVNVNELGNFLKAQISYLKLFFKTFEQVLSPTEDNIRIFNETKSYITIFTNSYFWLTNFQIEFGKFGITIPTSLAVWKNFIELIELISPNQTDTMYQELNKIIINKETHIFIAIDDFLEHLKITSQSQNKVMISEFQGAVLFRCWPRDQEDFVPRLLKHINEDENFSNYCTNVLIGIMGCKGLSQITKIVEQLEPDNLDDIQMELNDCIERDEYNNNLSIILADYFDQIIEDPDIDQPDKNESRRSMILTANFDIFKFYIQKVEKENNELNCLQTIAILAFFRNYIRHYVKCYLEGTGYKILKSIDDILKNESFLTNNLCVFALKRLLQKKVSFEKLSEFLKVKTAEWIMRFKQDLETVPQLNILRPVLLEPNLSIEIEDKWKEFSSSSFIDEKVFVELLSIAKTSHLTQYQFLNLFLANAYTGLISQTSANNLKKIMENKKKDLQQVFNIYQLKLLDCYINRQIDQKFLNATNNTELSKQILVLNTVNWLVCLSEFNSAWTTLFFEKGLVPENFSRHFNEQFMFAGGENPYVQNALKVLAGYKYNGVYMCSTECDFMYSIGNCGWPKATTKCPFCGNEIGKHKFRPQHTLTKEARRLGRKLQSWNKKTYCDNIDFQRDQEYWNELKECIILEIDRMRERKTIKIRDNGSILEKHITGYNRYPQQGDNSIDRLEQVTDYFLQFILHSSLYVFFALEWIKPTEASDLLRQGDINTPLEYFKERIESNIEALQRSLNCTDSMVWVLGIQQILWEIVEKNPINNTSISYKDRESFETEVQNLIFSNLGDQKMSLIKKYKILSQSSQSKFEKILREEEITPRYKFLKVLRISKCPSLDNMRRFHKGLIKDKYPILDECLNNLLEIQDISRMATLIKFSNEVMRMADYQITREEAKKTKILDFINSQQESRKNILKDLLDKFLEDWNSLCASLGPIQYECKILGRMTKYDENTPIIAFVVDSMDLNNEYGKILTGVIYNLSEKQNAVLGQIGSRAQNFEHLKKIQFFDNNIYLPQSANSEDILNITEDTIEEIIANMSASNFNYGNGAPVYDFERIQFNLVLKLVGKKMFLLDIKLYQNVRFIGEAFSQKGQYSDYITQVRELGLSSPIPDLDKLVTKFNTIKNRSPAEFYSFLKQLLGSLEKLMIFYKNLPEHNVTLSHYVKRWRFTAISAEITSEAPIKDYDIKCIVALYEWTENMMMPTVWQVLPDLYKSQQLTREERNSLKEFLIKLRDQWTENQLSVLSLAEFKTAIERFVLRCLLLGDFDEKACLNDWIYVREDFWAYPYKIEVIENFMQRLPRITLTKIYDLYCFVDAIINPPTVIPEDVQQPQSQEIIPKKNKPKGRRAANPDKNNFI